MRRPFLALVALLAAVAPAAAREDAADAWMSSALQGDLREAVEHIEQLDPDSASSRERELVDQVHHRFRDRDEDLPLPADPFVADVVRSYRDYWVRVLLGEESREAEASLLARLTEVMDRHGVPVSGGGASGRGPNAEDDALARLDGAIDRAGYGHISGRTLPHLELMLWARQDTTRYDVELTDGRREVTVVFVGDFLLKGWADFATFGRASTGGWATRDALFCLGDDYDRDSEKFRISYLKHETRHFADYDRFPALEQIDLEYRGKLTELAFAETSLGDLLETFEGQGAPNPAAPHSFAAFAVIRDLRREIGIEGEAPSDWRAVDVEAVHHAARTLIERSTRALEAAGAETVRGVVRAGG